jgi:hypothetical protein
MKTVVSNPLKPGFPPETVLISSRLKTSQLDCEQLFHLKQHFYPSNMSVVHAFTAQAAMKSIVARFLTDSYHSTHNVQTPAKRYLD